jgi:hypothetical protein
VKGKIKIQEGIPKTQQKLFIDIQQLDLGKISDYNITTETTIDLQFGLSGGAKVTKKDRLKKHTEAIKGKTVSLNKHSEANDQIKEVNLMVQKFILATTRDTELDTIKKKIKAAPAPLKVNLGKAFSSNNVDYRESALAKIVFAEELKKVQKMKDAISDLDSYIKEATSYLLVKEYGEESGNIGYKKIIQIIMEDHVATDEDDDLKDLFGRMNV